MQSAKLLKLLEDNTEENLYDLGYGQDFLDPKLESGCMKEIIDKLEFNKIKSFCSAKDNVNRKQTGRKYL